MKQNTTDRPCGDCTACCTIMGVSGLNKPHYTPCQHICPGGCAIYSDKPAECNVWECAWKSGWIDGDERRRPDKLGVIFEYRLVGGKSFLWVYEVWPNALDDAKVKYLLSRLGKSEIVVKCRYGSMRVDAEPQVLAFLIDHECETKGTPIVPLCSLADDSGQIVGTLVTERVGNTFVMKQVRA